MRPIAALFLLLVLAASGCTRKQQPIEMPTPHPPKRSAPNEFPLLSPWSLALSTTPAVCPAQPLARS